MNQLSLHLESPWPHRLAVVLVCATFPLIWVGGLVTTYDAGMAVPDWPGTYGYNLFLYPWQTWLFGPFDLFIEHGHRLLGAAVGIITIAVVGAVFWFDRRLWMRFAVITAVCLVVAQGSLGGARVLADERKLALMHGCLGPAFFAFAVALAAFTSRWWKSAEQPVRHTGVNRLQLLAGVTTLLAFVQLVVGAHLRHLPVDAAPSYFRIAVMFHLLLAALLAGHVVCLAVVVFRQHRRKRRLQLPAISLCVLLAVQLCLGGATWVVKYSWPEWFAGFGFAERFTVEAEGLGQALTVTAHVATGSLILAVATLLTLRAARLVRPLEISNLKSQISNRHSTASLWSLST
jgi:cytochrome c oxidase assembly protein subunit 15